MYVLKVWSDKKDEKKVRIILRALRGGEGREEGEGVVEGLTLRDTELDARNSSLYIKIIRMIL